MVFWMLKLPEKYKKECVPHYVEHTRCHFAEMRWCVFPHLRYVSCNSDYVLENFLHFMNLMKALDAKLCTKLRSALSHFM